MADGGQVHADLVGASRLEPADEPGDVGLAVRGDDLVRGARLPPAFTH